MDSFTRIIKLQLAILVVLAAIDFSTACDGHSMQLVSIKPCSDIESAQVFRFNGTTNITLTNDCRILTYGCVEWDAYEKADVTFSLLKNEMTVMKKQMDLCEMQKSSPFLAILKSLGFSQTCPSSKGSQCVNGNRAINIINKKTMMLALLNGETKLRFDIQHERRRSCHEIELKVVRQKK